MENLLNEEQIKKLIQFNWTEEESEIKKWNDSDMIEFARLSHYIHCSKTKDYEKLLNKYKNGEI